MSTVELPAGFPVNLVLSIDNSSSRHRRCARCQLPSFISSLTRVHFARMDVAYSGDRAHHSGYDQSPSPSPGADLRQKAFSATLPERPPLPSLLLPPLPSHPLPFSSPLLEVGPSNPARGSVERCKLLQWVWGGAPAENEFGAF